MRQKAIIPLYLNSLMVENLFTILVQEFSLSQKNNTKEQVVLNIDTPLREIIRDKYVQGDLKLQLLNEFSRENFAEVRIKRIDVFVQLMKILTQQHLIKTIDTKNINTKEINNGDYVEIECELEEDPLIRWFQDVEATVNSLFYLDETKAKEISSTDFIQKVQCELNNYNESKNTRLVTEKFSDNNIRFTFLIEDSFIEGEFGHMLEGPVTVIGKVIKKMDYVKKQENTSRKRKVSTYCDKFLNYMEMDKLKNKVDDITKKVHGIEIPNGFLENDENDIVYKIIPLAIYF